MQQKSKDELKDFILILNKSLQNIQSQCNYWKEAREQLVADAEMQNKMIANLVSYAQQQQQGSQLY